MIATCNLLVEHILMTAHTEHTISVSNMHRRVIDLFNAVMVNSHSNKTMNMLYLKAVFVGDIHSCTHAQSHVHMSHAQAGTRTSSTDDPERCILESRNMKQLIIRNACIRAQDANVIALRSTGSNLLRPCNC